MTAPTNDFDAAKAVVDQLAGMDKERQQRILRWVAESLHIEVAGAFHSGTGAHTNTAGPAPIAMVVPVPQKSPTDIKSFVESRKPKSDVQFAAVVAYYYRFEAAQADRRESIDPATLQDAARLAARRRLPSPKTTLSNAKRLGYLDSAERGQYRINSVGENLVAMTLPGGESEPRTRSRKPSSKRVAAKSAKKTSPRKSPSKRPQKK